MKITSSEVSTFVGKLISSNIWIALNDVAEPGEGTGTGIVVNPSSKKNILSPFLMT